MAEEAKTKKSVAKNVGDIGGDETTFQGTPKDKYFESTLIASNKPTPDLRKRGNASHRKYNKDVIDKKKLESKGDNVSNTELGELNVDDAWEENIEKEIEDENIELNVDMCSMETCGVEKPRVEDNVVDNVDLLSSLKQKDVVQDETEVERVDNMEDVSVDIMEDDRVEEDGRLENVFGETEEVTEGKKRKEPPKKREKLQDIGIIKNLSRNGPFEGGPSNNCILTSFYDHIALYVWYGKERKPLSLTFHSKKLREWEINASIHTTFIEKLEETNLVSLRICPESCDRALVSAFVERWHEETSSFHLPFGEMTITLDDVVQIIGLKTQGKFITPKILNDKNALELVVKVLGVEEHEVNKEIKGRAVRLEWLKSKFGTKMVGSEEELKYCVRAYILFTIGCVLCPDKTGSRVSVNWLLYLEDVDNFSDIPFGTLALAFLYYQLNSASKAKTTQICGLIPLLEVWILEHFPNIATRGVVEDYREMNPRIMRWQPSLGVYGSSSALVNYRQRIDAMTCLNVIFDPYEAYRHTTRRISEITFYQCQLRVLSHTVLYLPNRVLRQFGFRQRIPVKEAKYGDNLTKWEKESEMYVLDEDDREKIVEGDSLDNDYIQWYEHHSHPRCQNVEHWNGPKLVPTSIGQLNVEGFIKNTLTAQVILKEIMQGQRMTVSQMRERVEKAIAVIGEWNQDEDFGNEPQREEARPQKQAKVAANTKSKKKPVKKNQVKKKASGRSKT